MLNCISYSIVCNLTFCSELLNIPDKTGRVRRRTTTQAIAKRFAFHTNAINVIQNGLDVNT